MEQELRAIIVPYCVDQHEPSKPLRKLYDLPTNEEECKQFLFDLWMKEFQEERRGVFEYELVFRRRQDENDYGDYIVGDGELFLCATLIEN